MSDKIPAYLAWKKWSGKEYGSDYQSFRAGWASRDAEVKRIRDAANKVLDMAGHLMSKDVEGYTIKEEDGVRFFDVQEGLKKALRPEGK